MSELMSEIQNGTVANTDDCIDAGLGTSAMLADTLNRWKYTPKTHAEIIKLSKDSSSDDENHEDNDARSSTSSIINDSANISKRSNSKPVLVGKNAENASTSSEEQGEEEDVSEGSEYRPTSESSDGEWRNKQRFLSDGMKKESKKVQMERKELQSFLKSRTFSAKKSVLFDPTSAKSSLELLRRIREDRRRKREKRLGIHSDTSDDEENDKDQRSSAKLSEDLADPSLIENELDNQVSVRPEDLLSGMMRSRQILMSDDEDDQATIKQSSSIESANNSNHFADILTTDCLPSGSKKRKVLVAPDNSDDETDDAGVSEKAAFQENQQLKKPMPKLSKSMLRARTLKFFDSATEEELQTIPRCNTRMAKLIIEGRPYENYSNMVQKFSDRKGISVTICEAYMDTLRVQQSLDCILYDCQTISSKVGPDLETLKNGNFDKIEKPSIMVDSLILKPYQLIGLNWLIMLHKRGLNAILADEMGNKKKE